MQGDASQRAIDSSAVSGFLRKQILFIYRQHNPMPLSVPTPVAKPGASAYVLAVPRCASHEPDLGQQCLASPTAADRLPPCDRQAARSTGQADCEA
eukprot:5939908-Pleurochrysis_carterae.AAC.1